MINFLILISGQNNKVGTSSVIIGRYERNEITPSLDVAAKIYAVVGLIDQQPKLFNSVTLAMCKHVKIINPCMVKTG